MSAEPAWLPDADPAADSVRPSPHPRTKHKPKLLRSGRTPDPAVTQVPKSGSGRRRVSTTTARTRTQQTSDVPDPHAASTNPPAERAGTRPEPGGCRPGPLTAPSPQNGGERVPAPANPQPIAETPGNVVLRHALADGENEHGENTDRLRRDWREDTLPAITFHGHGLESSGAWDWPPDPGRRGHPADPPAPSSVDMSTEQVAEWYPALAGLEGWIWWYYPGIGELVGYSRDVVCSAFLADELRADPHQADPDGAFLWSGIRTDPVRERCRVSQLAGLISDRISGFRPIGGDPTC